MRRSTWILSAALLVAHGLTSAAGAPQFVPTLLLRNACATGINSAGKVVGQSTDVRRYDSAFYFDGVSTIIIPGIRGYDVANVWITDDDQIYGTFRPTLSSPSRNLFHYDGVRASDLGSLDDLFGNSMLGHVNNHGVFVGSRLVKLDGPDRTSAAFVSNLERSLVVPGDRALFFNQYGLDINDSNLIAGAFTVLERIDDIDLYIQKPGVYVNGQWNNLLSDMPGQSGSAVTINARGHTAGNTGDGVAFFHDGAALTSLGRVDGQSTFAIDINDNDILIGFYSQIGRIGQAPLLFEARRGRLLKFLSLLTQPIEDLSLTAINNTGQIAGCERVSASKQHAYLFNPMWPADANE